MANPDQTWDGYYSTAWNNAGNWNPGDAVPTNIAHFANTIYNHVVDVGQQPVTIQTIAFDPGSDTYSFNIQGMNAHLTINGNITGNALLQTFSISAGGTVDFQNGTSDNPTLNVNAQGTLTYHNSSDAGASKLVVAQQGTVNFLDISNAKGSTINSQGSVLFWGQSSAGNTTLQEQSGKVIFYNSSNAGGGSNIQVFNGAQTYFYDSSQGGSSNITVNGGGVVTFSWGTTAAKATIDIKNSGVVSMVGNSAGGSASLVIEAGGVLDASAHAVGNVYFGSISNAGTIKVSAGTEVLAGAPPAATGGHAPTTHAGVATPAPVAGTITGGGEFGVNYGTLVFAGNDQSTASLVALNGALELAAGAQVAGGLAYEGLSWVGPVIQFDTASVATTQIKAMARSDAADIRFHAFSASDQAVWVENGSNSAGTLTIGTGASAVTLNIAGVHTSSEFKLATDGAGGTLVTDQGTSQSVSQGLADIAGNASFGRVDIVDSSANVLGGLNNLQAIAANIASITLTDSSAPVFNLTAAQSVADHGALAMIASPVSFNVTATTSGFNSLEGGLGNDTLTGSATGLNTAIFTGAAPEYTITTSGSSIVVADGYAHRDGTDTLTNIQRVQFSNGILAFDINGDAGQAYRMYQAAFARTPDQTGVSYWVSQVDHGLSLQGLAQNFINSAEFQGLYGTNPSASAIVTGFYTNVLGRAPDAAGLSYWLGVLQSGTSEAGLLVSFSESAENQAHINPGLTHGIALTSSFFS